MPSANNFNLIEGDWKEFQIRRITPFDYPAVLEHVREYFIKDEPLCKLLGYSDEFADHVLLAVKHMLEDNLSFLAEHRLSKELAAVRITFRASKSTSFDTIIDPKELHWKADVFINYIDLTTAQKYSILEQYGVNEYAELFIIATKPKFRGQGLCMELYRRSLKFLKAEGFGLAKCVFTHPATRKSGFNLGFTNYQKFNFRDFKDKEGKLIFSSENLNDEHYAVAAFLKL